MAPSMNKLQQLPDELLLDILHVVDCLSSIRDLSLVSWRLRRLCIPILFRQYGVQFRAASFDRLARFSATPFAQFVNEIVYTVPQFVGPGGSV